MQGGVRKGVQDRPWIVVILMMVMTKDARGREEGGQDSYTMATAIMARQTEIGTANIIRRREGSDPE